MKKLLLILLMFLSVNAYSQVTKYYSDFSSYKSLVSKDKWTDWSDWESCYHKIIIDLDSNTIIINNSKYTIDKYVETIIDDNSKTIKYAVINYDNKACFIRIREQKDGVKQLYIDHDDIIYVYNIVY